MKSRLNRATLALRAALDAGPATGDSTEADGMNPNDDIAVQLRSHWHAVADTRPAVDQLQNVLSVTEQIKPRHAWSVRLANAADALPLPQVNFAGQIALVLLLVLLTVALGAGLAVVGGPGPAAQPTPFEGTWTAIDRGDGSDMLLVVSAGNEPSVRYEDYHASACTRQGDSNDHWIGEGKGEIDGDTMVVSYETSGCTTYREPPHELTYVYDEGSKTLVDGRGDTWHKP